MAAKDGAVTFAEHRIMKVTGCTLEVARDVERLMRDLKTKQGRSVTDMPDLRFEALAREAEAGVTLLTEGDV